MGRIGWDDVNFDFVAGNNGVQSGWPAIGIGLKWPTIEIGIEGRSEARSEDKS